MLLTDGFVIQLIVIIISVILSYLLYKYLNNDLIDITKLVKNDVEKFTNFNADMFSDETAYPILENTTNILNDIKDEYQITEQMDNELKRLQMYMRK